MRAHRNIGKGPEPILLIFLDGVGLGEADAAFNPFFRAELPTLGPLFGGTPPYRDHPLLQDPGVRRPPAADPAAKGPAPRSSDPSRPHPGTSRLFALDATLDTEGTPQSGTGQISLLTGRNAARRFGRHFGPWPPVRLRPLLEAENLFRRLLAEGRAVRFANAYPYGYPEGVPTRRVAAPALAAHAAGILRSGPRELARGEAVASNLDHEGWRRFSSPALIPPRAPVESGRVLARLANGEDFTFFAHYSTDTAGHRGGMGGAVEALERVDAFLGGVFEGIDPRTLVLVAGDHGNIEDVRGGHTRNPALGAAFGPPDRVGALPLLASLLDVVPAVMEATRRVRPDAAPPDLTEDVPREG